jgi:hypothetical protein
MNLMATQLGTSKKVAESGKAITVPAMETFEIKNGETKYTLKHTPKAAPTEIYALNGDSTFGTKYTKATGTTASETSFAIDGTSVTVPTGIAAGTQMFVMYEYESESAVEVVNSATQFPVGCKFVMEVLGCDVCDQTNLIYAYVIFNNAKLSPDFDWSIQTDSTHPFSMKAQQDLINRSLVA